MRRRIREDEKVSYWKSMVDAIATLMMVILLILMFFVLNFLINRDNNPEHDDYDGYENGGYGYTYSGGEHETPTPTISLTPTPTPYDDDNGGGGGDGEYPEPTPTPVIEGDDFIGYDKVAVYAVLVDEETEQVLPIPDIAFELYTNTKSKVNLSTHYPELITYTQYVTTESGDFYLPEKVRVGTYYFHQLTEIPGYDYIDDYYFDVESGYDWNNPYVVKIPVGASTNNIQIQLVDGITEEPIPYVTFDVISDGDLLTPDGTIRYRDGDIADTIICDSEGYGLSKSLYLGNYVLVPHNLPDGYGAPSLDSRKVVLTRRTAGGEYAPLKVLESVPTTVRVSVTDELDTTVFVPGVAYELTSLEDGSRREYVTNSAGFFEITDLEKSTTYRLQEVSHPEGYIPNEEPYEFTVDSLGLIEGTAEHDINISCRMIRAEINVVDRVTKQPLNGYNCKLIDKEGNVVYTWVSDGSTYKIDGIKEGVYTLKLEGSSDKMVINIKNVSEVQKFTNSVMTTRSYVLLISIGVIIVFMITLGVVKLIPLIRTRRKNNKEKNTNQESK